MDRDEARQVRSPISDPPQHDPGQSLREQLDTFRHEEILARLVAIIIAWVLVFYETVKWLLDAKSHPMPVVAMATVVSIYMGVKLGRSRTKARSLRLGIEGERYVGQLLDEKLRPMGYAIIHDVCEDGYNIDHVVIGPGGIFSIETKTRSKPGRGRPTVIYDGQQVIVDGHVPDRDPIAQARAAADRVQTILHNLTGRRVEVQPVVLYPGWYVPKTDEEHEVWVLNEKFFIGRLRGRRTVVTREDQALYTDRLKLHCTSQDKTKA